MADLWKIIVIIVKQMLHINGSFIEHPKKISIIVTDDVRVNTFVWKFGGKNG